MNPPRELSIVTVTYRSEQHLDAFADAVVADGWIGPDGSPTERAELIIVDSGSDDGTRARIRNRIPRCQLLASSDNLGYGAACNLAANIAEGRWILFVNPDVILPRGTVQSLLDHAAAHPSAAAVGPGHHDRAGASAIATQDFPSLGQEVRRQWAMLAAPLGFSDRGDRAPAEAGPVDWISGACMLVETRLFAAIGGFDPAFFLYYEETDLCRRIWEAGREVHHLPAVFVVHRQGGSATRDGSCLEAGRLPAHFRRSRGIYFRKHHGRLVAAAVEGVHWARRLARSIKGGRRAH